MAPGVTKGINSRCHGLGVLVRQKGNHDGKLPKWRKPGPDRCIRSYRPIRLGRFIEGRLSKLWIKLAAPLLDQGQQYPQLLQAWGHKFIMKLHNMVHKQWVYHNIFIHFKGADGLMIPQHCEILAQVEDYASMDPETLLPRHRFLFKTDLKS